jgi:hypothetical protein
VKRYRVRCLPATAETAARSALLQAIHIEDHGTYVVAVVAGEPLFELATLADVLSAMKLSAHDIEPDQ